VKLVFPASPKYSEGKNVLTDGIVKKLNTWHPGDLSGWQAMEAKDLEATIDFEKQVRADSISINCLGHKAAWILLPKEVVIEVSADSKKYRKLSVISYPYASYSNRKIVRYSAAAGKESFRFLKVKAVNAAVLPETHPAKGKPAWLFADEIVVQ
jgi:hexosaminidase